MSAIAGVVAAAWRLCALGLVLAWTLAAAQSAGTPEGAARWRTLNAHVRQLYVAGKYEEGIAAATEALRLAELEFGSEHPKTGASLNNLALLYQSMGAYEMSLPLLERALTIAEKALGADHPDTGTSLNSLAFLYKSMGAYDQALPLYERALRIREKALGTEHPSTGNSLNNLAVLYRSMGAYDQALPLLERALRIVEKALGPDDPLTGTSLSNLALLYESMGAHDKALPLYERALRITEKALGPDHSDTGTILNNLAELYRSMGAYDQALPLYKRALGIKEKALGSDHPNTGASLNNLALLHQSMGAYDQALPLYERALRIAEKALGPDHPLTGTSLNNLAELHQSMGALDKALPLFERALVISLARMQQGFDPELLATTASNYCVVLVRPSSANEAIFYCKLAVNVRQQQRAGARGLDKTLKESFARRVENEYKLLARLLSQSGRLAEAEQVMLALKDAEYGEFLRGAQMPPGSQVPLTPAEQALADELNELATRLAPVYKDLDAHRTGLKRLDDDGLSRRTELRDALQQQLRAKLSEVAARLASAKAEPATTVKLDDTLLSRLTAALSAGPYGEPNVAVSYIVEERVTTVLVIGPAGPAALQLAVGSTTLDPLIDALRLALHQKADYRDPARALYQHLIAPVDAHLLARGLAPRTLMLYLTDRLRYLPFAALIDDGGRHLIETRRLAVLTTAAINQAGKDPIVRWGVDAFGSTTGKSSANLVALPAVREEMSAIVRSAGNPRGVLAGRQWLDAEFTRTAWKRLLDAAPGDGRAGVIHVATHFQSVPGNWYQSYLLLGDGGEFRLSELRDAASMNLDDVELITLSACATELTDRADGKEFEGLGALLQNKGAHAVIGTLWPVQDEGSARLMTAFYSARGEQRLMSKAAALQAAQLRLLRGEVKSNNPVVDLRHPYYWAPYVLMGNWL